MGESIATMTITGVGRITCRGKMNGHARGKVVHTDIEEICHGFMYELCGLG